MTNVPHGVIAQVLPQPPQPDRARAADDEDRQARTANPHDVEGCRHSLDPLRHTDRYRLATPYSTTRDL